MRTIFHFDEVIELITDLPKGKGHFHEGHLCESHNSTWLLIWRRHLFKINQIWDVSIGPSQKGRRELGGRSSSWWSMNVHDFEIGGSVSSEPNRGVFEQWKELTKCPIRAIAWPKDWKGSHDLISGRIFLQSSAVCPLFDHNLPWTIAIDPRRNRRSKEMPKYADTRPFR
jgi:hypothetical protein